MKKTLSAMFFFAVLGCLNSVVFAAELLDVNPVVSGSAVSIEISADIAMAYTFYKVPGQTQAIVDITEVDPEKVEPLIVVNKGAVSSISIDKVLISGIVASRVIFNLVSEADISVSASPDRKLLTVTFGDSTVAPDKQEPKPESAATAVPPSEPVVKAAPSLVTRTNKLEPVVPDTLAPTRHSILSVKKVTTGASYIEIRTNQPVTDYKATKLSGPYRLVIDIAAEKVNQKPKSVSINKFGITRVRIGVSPRNIRIVIDSGKTKFPAHTITNTDDGLRINFK